MNKLPKNNSQLADLIYSCIDLSEYDEGSTLLEVIKSEKMVSKLTISVVEDWLRGLPTACTIPYWNGEIEELLESSGNSHWSVNDYWRWCASRVKAFAEHPEAYK